MKSEHKKMLRTLLLILIGIAVTVVAWFSLFSKTALEPSPWLRQASSMRQVGLVLLGYLKTHGGKPPQDLAELGEWAEAQDPFKGATKAKYWRFVDPETGAKMDWKIGKFDQGIYLYAPKPQTTYAHVPPWLVLSKCEVGQVRYDFVKNEPIPQPITPSVPANLGK